MCTFFDRTETSNTTRTEEKKENEENAVIGWMNALLKRGGAGLAALVSAAVVNAGLAAALIGLGSAGAPPDSSPWLVSRPIEVAWEVPDPPKPEPRPVEHQETPASACEPLTEPTPPAPRTEAGADMSPLSLDVALDLPDLPPLHVDPSAVLGSIDWSTLTAQPVPADPRPARPALPEGPLDALGVDVPPEKRYAPPPPFPSLALRRNIVKGTVEARILVNSRGRVVRIRIEKANPRGYFEQAVRRAVDRWEFTPARYRGQSVDCWCRQRFQFFVEDR